MNDKELQTLRDDAAKAAKAADEALQISPSQGSAQHTPYPGWTPSLVISLSFSILVFGLLVMLLISRLVMRGTDLNALIRAFALILIIVAAIFLVVAGYTQEQIAPVMGLLGTIAGYLLGNTQKTDKTNVTTPGKDAQPNAS